jgi:hypothetical protein
MDPEIWALCPISECLMMAGCESNSVGHFHCEGCIGKGKRVSTSEVFPVEVIMDHAGRPMAVNTLEDF